MGEVVVVVVDIDHCCVVVGVVVRGDNHQFPLRAIVVIGLMVVEMMGVMLMVGIAVRGIVLRVGTQMNRGDSFRVSDVGVVMVVDNQKIG